MSTAPATQTPTTPKTPRRWWRAALALGVLLGLVPLALLLYLNWSTSNAWDEAEAEADQLDPRWRLAELEADRAPVPDAENAALQILLAQSKGPRVFVTGAANFEQIFAKLTPTAQLNEQQIQLIQGELNKIPVALKEARALKDMPRGRFAVTFSDDWISTRISNHQEARQMGDWLAHDAYLLAHEGECDKALESCRALLNAGRAAGDDRFLISHLIRLAIQETGVRAVERVLAQGQTSEESLLALQTLIAREIAECNWSGSMRSERAGHHHLFTNIRSGKVSTTVFFGMGNMSPSLADRIRDTFPSTTLKHYPEHLRMMNRLVEISKLPLHEQKASFKEIEQSVHALRNPISLLMPPYTKLSRADQRSQATLRSALAALACERYRLKHERWPESLDVLVRERLLAAAPADPWDNQPIRYRRGAEMIVVYSIGVDEKDDGGNVDHEKIFEPGVDIGFRVWHEGERRGPPLPPVAIMK